MFNWLWQWWALDTRRYGIQFSIPRASRDGSQRQQDLPDGVCLNDGGCQQCPRCKSVSVSVGCHPPLGASASRVVG